jgi:hypothetical protein
MKKTLLLFLGIMLSAAAYAQVPVKRTMAMVEKSTASWCGPCGTWGWLVQEDLIADNMIGTSPNAIVLETHGAFSAFHTETAMFLIQSWIDTTLPRWAVNNMPDPNNSTNTRYSVKKVVDSLAALSPTASTGFYYTITGNTIKFYTKTQFWKAASGTYSMAAYIVEDSAYGEQQGQPGANAYHRYVLRDRISKYTFGDTLVAGSVAQDQAFTKNYTYNITRTDWVKSHLSFVTVLFKRNASDSTKSEVINVNSLKSASTGVAGLVESVDQLIVYPNPANDHVRFSGALNIAHDTRIALVNALGQTVYEKLLPWNGNQLNEDIPVSGLSNGVYQLIISTEGARTIQRVTVTH